MQHYKCKCGTRQMWGSVGPDPCFECAECHTTLEADGAAHRRAKAHQWVTNRVETDEGPALLSYCQWCGVLKKEA